ncbi:MAG TPA: hypothetical protein VJ385_02230 [Fibrobacteria bacterium]|nr:hypothetical protein [Fibrobacteria bacterium]
MGDEIIATRKYEIVDEGGVKSPLLIHLFKPVPDGDDWRCKVEIHEKGNVWPHSVVGIDALQALNIAITRIKSEVFSFQKLYKGGFEFLDQQDELWV